MGLIFEGHLLAYDPVYNIAEWVPICRMVRHLSPAEESLSQELSNITLLKEMQGTPQIGQFSKGHPRHEPVSVPKAGSLTLETEMQRVSFVAQGGADIC